MTFPKAERLNIQTQLDGYEKPEILTDSLESTIAGKFDAILKRFELTSRMKDFYDIYYLSKAFDFDGLKLQTAIQKTLQNRQASNISSMDDIQNLLKETIAEFIENGLDVELDDELGYSEYDYKNKDDDVIFARCPFELRQWGASAMS